MPGKRKRSSKAQLAPRGSRGHLKNGMCDLDVPIIQSKNKGSNTTSSSKGKTPSAPWRGIIKEQLALLERLEDTGYSTIALSHIVHGGNMKDGDHADKAIPDELFSTGIITNKKTKLKILKRLNVVIEQESDLAHFNFNNTKSKTILQSYDLIAFSPRNETVLSAICNSTAEHLFYLDIICLDYTAGRGGVQLPFRIKPTQIASASKQGLALELPYGPAIIDPSKRKGFVQAARQLVNACFKVRNTKPPPKIIVSSGCRVLNGTGKDHGAMVLRSAGDILNFCKVVLGFEDRLVNRVMSSDACLAVQKGKDRRNGKCTLSSVDGDRERGLTKVSVRIAEEDDRGNENNDDDDHDDKVNKVDAQIEIDTDKDSPDDSDDGDGFLRL